MSVNNNGTVINPYGMEGASLVRMDMTGILNPAQENKVVKINGMEARYTYYDGVYKFAVLVDGAITDSSDIRIEDGAPKRLIYGDLNADGETTSTDMNLLKGVLAGNRAPADYFEYLAADVKGDGELTSTDMNMLKGFLAGNLSTLSAPGK